MEILVMFFSIVPDKPSWRTCAGCGIMVHRGSLDAHRCNPEVAAAHQLPRVMDELHDWLETPAGRFEQFYAARGQS